MLHEFKTMKHVKLEIFKLPFVTSVTSVTSVVDPSISGAIAVAPAIRPSLPHDRLYFRGAKFDAGLADPAIPRPATPS